jgi:hypothetical protein
LIDRIEKDIFAEVKVNTEDMHLAGEIIQMLASLCELDNISSTAQFHREFTSLKSTIKRINETKSERVKQQAKMDRLILGANNLTSRAEESRRFKDYQAVAEIYKEILQANKDILSHRDTQMTAHGDLVASLKSINTTIQLAAKLRKGQPQARVIQEAREALKRNDIDQLIRVLANGA